MATDPITPINGPKFDEEGRLTYLGEDGSRYVVVEGEGVNSDSSQIVIDSLRSAGSTFQEIETLCIGWLHTVTSSHLSREEAIYLLFATLETVLETSSQDPFSETESIADEWTLEVDLDDLIDPSAKAKN